MITTLHRHRASVILGDRRGATIAEFAIVLIPFLVLTMGSIDLGYQVYVRALAAGAVERAARKAAVGNRTQPQIVDLIKAEVRTILPNSDKNRSDAVTVAATNFFNFSHVGGGERITGDTAPVGVYNSTDCYEDRNGNGRYDATGGGATGLGGADDIVYYDVTVSIPRLFPLASTIGWNRNITVNTKTLIRNQPYGSQAVRIRCS